MSEKPQTSKKPTHAIWQVTGEGERARWNRVGAAWMNKDRKGANLKLESVPLTGRLVLREISEQDNTTEDFNGASQAGAQ